MEDQNVDFGKITNDAINNPLTTTKDLFSFGETNGNAIGSFLAVLIIFGFLLGFVILLWKLFKNR